MDRWQLLLGIFGCIPSFDICSVLALLVLVVLTRGPVLLVLMLAFVAWLVI